MTKRYVAEIKSLNEEIVGTTVTGKAEIIEESDRIKIKVEASGTPSNMVHWGHLHGFEDGEKGQVPTKEADMNGDGIIDMKELHEVAGHKMVPFDDAPHNLNFAHDTFPPSDGDGNWKYEFEVPLAELIENLKEKFGIDELPFDKWIVVIHGVPDHYELPDTVEGTVGDYGPHTTLPIGAGEFEEE